MGAMNQASITTAQMEEVEKSLPVLFERGDSGNFFSMIEKRNVKKVSDKAMRVTLEISPGGYFGHYNPDGGDMGRGAGPSFTEATISTYHFRHALEWTHKADISTDDARKSVVQAFKHIVAKAMPDFRRHVNAMCMTDGTGVLATVESTSNDGTYDTVILSNYYGAKLLRKGQKVTVYDSAMNTHRTSGGEKEITFYDVQNRTIKFTTLSGLVAGDKICISGLSGSSPTSLFGLEYHHNNASVGTWLAMNRADYPEIRCNGVNAASEFKLGHARLAKTMIGDRLGADMVKKLVAKCHPCQVQAYEEQGQLISMIQKGSGSESLNLYFGDNMQLAGSTLQQDYSWNKTRIDFINPEVWGRAEMEAIKFYTDANGNKFFAVRSSDGGVAAANLFYIVASFNIYNMNPGSEAYIYNLPVPDNY